MRAVAVLGTAALILSACGGDDGDDTESDVASEAATEASEMESDASEMESDMESEMESETEAGGEASASADGVLHIGTLLPETGDLAFLGPPEFAAAELAVQELNEAGGILGADVELTQGDSGDTNTDIANQTVDEHLAAGTDAIVGAASSGVSLTVIDKITGANVIHFSPANTSPTFTDYDDNGLYFRTAPSDVLQGRILADNILADGGQNVVMLVRQDSYGEGLRDFTLGPLEEAGATVTPITYDPSATEFAAEVQQVVQAAPDTILVIAFAETEQLVKGLIEAQVGPQSGIPYWFTDGNIGNSMGENFDDAPGVLAGVRGTLPSAETAQDFRDRLLEVDPELVDFSYSAETYDAVVITALAAAVAGTDDPVAVGAEINGVTRDGEKCTDIAGCLELIEAGTDIDYDGVGGPYEFSDAGEPTEASFAILEYGEDNRINDELTEFQFAAMN
ncbi:MAG TPA: ABC transporter substrate-binding protein [Nitriliruptoraceae bacterium]|nr:ABC transporter substrate-binding protein [Nitriliruptoraceae bacterium]